MRCFCHIFSLDRLKLRKWLNSFSPLKTGQINYQQLGLKHPHLSGWVSRKWLSMDVPLQQSLPTSPLREQRWRAKPDLLIQGNPGCGWGWVRQLPSSKCPTPDISRCLGGAGRGPWQFPPHLAIPSYFHLWRWLPEPDAASRNQNTCMFLGNYSSQRNPTTPLLPPA